MTQHRYPSDTEICKDDFDPLDCQKVLNTQDCDDYFSMYTTLSQIAQDAAQDDDWKRSKVYWLLADACSLELVSSSTNEPFKPFAVFPHKRSAITDDFSEEDIRFLSEIIPSINNSRLKARLADLVWSVLRNNIALALLAIDAYREIPLTASSWIKDGRECWHRAFSLAAMLRSGAGTRIQDMENQVLQAFDATQTADGYLALWLSDLLSTFHLGKDHSDIIATKLHSFAATYETNNEYEQSRNYCRTSITWYRLSKNDSEAIDATIHLADLYSKEASVLMTCDPPNSALAADRCENAIQVLRTIPKTDRGSFNVDERIKDLHLLLNESGAQSVSELDLISTPDTDITKLVETAQNAVAGVSASQAIHNLANIAPGISCDRLRAKAVEQITKHPISSLFGGTYLSKDGRTIAKTTGVDFDELSEDDPATHPTVMQNHSIHLQLIVQGRIIPALQQIHLEHRIREVDFRPFVYNSSIIPPGREYLFSKGLYAGYDMDFAAAIHILIPQVEHLVRFHLKNTNVKTSTLDSQGIENENGLSTLVALPEMNEIFGKDLTFEIKALFCDSIGANLRNELAHGLLDFDDCNSYHVVYAWWLILKLVYRVFHNSARQPCQTTGSDSMNTDTDIAIEQ